MRRRSRLEVLRDRLEHGIRSALYRMSESTGSALRAPNTTTSASKESKARLS